MYYGSLHTPCLHTTLQSAMLARRHCMSLLSDWTLCHIQPSLVQAADDKLSLCQRPRWCCRTCWALERHER